MPIYLSSLSLKNYRGIDASIVKMSPFKSFNFFIGANNSGKSTVLNFISRHCQHLAQAETYSLLIWMNSKSIVDPMVNQYGWHSESRNTH